MISSFPLSHWLGTVLLPVEILGSDHLHARLLRDCCATTCVNAGSQDAEVEITVMIIEFIIGIKVVKLQMRNEAKLRKLQNSLHELHQTWKTVEN